MGSRPLVAFGNETSSWGNCMLFIWIGGHGECDVNPLGSISFYSPILNQFWIAARFVCSFCEAMVGSLSVASTAVLPPNVVVVDSSEVGRSAVYRMINNGPRTLLLRTPALTGESSVYSV
jgi:hypothetical protein